MSARNRFDMKIDPQLKDDADKEAADRGTTLSGLIKDHLRRITAHRRKARK